MLDHGLLERTQVGGAAAVVDVRPVAVGEEGDDVGLEAAFAFDGGAASEDFATDYAGEVAFEGAAGD